MKIPLFLGHTVAWFVVCAAALLAIGTSLAFAETPGEYFRKFMAKHDAECKERQLGPYMPADEPPRSPKRAITDCNGLFLKPWWETLDEAGKFAHSIKLPSPHDKLPDVYKLGMSPREYFDALCAAQSGEFIFKKVSDVEGVVDLRPRMPESTTMNRHLTALEDSVTFTHWQSAAPENASVVRGLRYLETTKGGNRLRIYREAPNVPAQERIVRIENFSAPVGFVWRGLYEPHQIELGISGGELILLDTRTQEILGVKRGFRLRWLGKYALEQSISITGIDGGHLSCKQEIEQLKRGIYKDWRDFLLTVISPKN